MSPCEITLYCELNCVPQIGLEVPQEVTVFEDKAFKQLIRVWGEVVKVKRGQIHSDGRRSDFGGEHTVQDTDGVL